MISLDFFFSGMMRNLNYGKTEIKTYAIILGALEICIVTVLNIENWKKPIDLLFLPVVLLSQSPYGLMLIILGLFLFLCL